MHACLIRLIDPCVYIVVDVVHVSLSRMLTEHWVSGRDKLAGIRRAHTGKL